jgi:glycine/D-amino acid oxidase-like deaminating enzyme
MRVAVIGAGIIGLWTAYELNNRGYDVVVYAASNAEVSTSGSAVAVITPLFPWSLEKNPALFAESLGWFYETLAKFKELNSGNDFMNAIPSYEFGYVDETGCAVLEKGFPASRLTQLNFAPTQILATQVPIAVQNEVDHVDQVTFAVNFVADMVDTQMFLPFFRTLLQESGVEFRQKKFEIADQLNELPEEWIFNCTGIFSKFLFPEVGLQMYPIRGQSHFIAAPNDPPYFGIASGHHAVFRHKRGYYLGSYFLAGGGNVWHDGSRGDLASLIMSPQSRELELTRKFSTETYVLLAAEMGIEAEPVPFDGVWRINAGVRPFSEEGPIQQVRTFGNKRIVDNIGHGAHGWTIGYGSTKIAVDIFEGSQYGK